jgi:hypothetical protein
MLRKLRSCVTLLRELRIVNQYMLSGPPDSSQQTSHNANIVFDLPSIMFNMNRLSKEQQIRVVAALVEGNIFAPRLG